MAKVDFTFTTTEPYKTLAFFFLSTTNAKYFVVPSKDNTLQIKLNSAFIA